MRKRIDFSYINFADAVIFLGFAWTMIATSGIFSMDNPTKVHNIYYNTGLILVVIGIAYKKLVRKIEHIGKDQHMDIAKGIQVDNLRRIIQEFCEDPVGVLQDGSLRTQADFCVAAKEHWDGITAWAGILDTNIVDAVKESSTKNERLVLRVEYKLDRPEFAD